MVRAERWSGALLFLAACASLHAPDDAAAPAALQRQLRLPLEQCWQLLHVVLKEQSLGIEEQDEQAHTLTTKRVHHRGATREIVEELKRVANLKQARGRGLRVLSGFSYDYRVSLSSLSSSETLMTISTHIEAVDRSQVVFGPFGEAIVVPRTIPLSSTGVVEARLLERVGGHVFGAEELLYLIGRPGYD